MNKSWWKSKTVWGALLLAVSTIIPVIVADQGIATTVQKILEGIGSFLGITGIRTAIAVNGNGA
jgi:hypothetical protein